MAPLKTEQSAISSPPSLSMASTLAGDASPSDPEVLRTLYSVLLRTRLLQEEVISLLRSGRIPGTAVPLLGGEATEVGACIGLQADDGFSSFQPKFATAVVRGIPIGSRESFEHMNRAIAVNKMRPVVDRIFPWTEARTALEYMREGKHFGKIVLRF